MRRRKGHDWIGGPRSRSAREVRDGGGPGMLMSSAEILRELYPLGGTMVRPWWAKLARRMGWMTDAAYWEVPKTEVDEGGGFPELAYDSLPLLGIIPKTEGWT